MLSVPSTRIWSWPKFFTHQVSVWFTDILKNPYVLEFLGYPNFAELRETDVERAIITHLQRFLLELGNGFAFVARQKHIRIDEDDRFIDLVFYHCRLKFYSFSDNDFGKAAGRG